jgi:hypothetical protein
MEVWTLLSGEIGKIGKDLSVKIARFYSREMILKSD